MRNFLDSLRSRRAEDLKASVEFGHVAAAVCHQGNISYRIGQTIAPEAAAESLAAVPAAQEIFRELQTHLGVHQIDLEQHRLTKGQWLEIEPDGEGIARIETGDERALEKARFLLRETQRPPFVIPEQV